MVARLASVEGMALDSESDRPEPCSNSTLPKTKLSFGHLLSSLEVIHTAKIFFLPKISFCCPWLSDLNKHAFLDIAKKTQANFPPKKLNVSFRQNRTIFS